MSFDHYPAVDENLEFPPSVAMANMPIALSTPQRDGLAAARKWDGRQIYNTSLKRYERWDAAAGTWRTIADQQDLPPHPNTLLTTLPPYPLATTGAVGTSTLAARSDHVHPEPAWTAYTPSPTPGIASQAGSWFRYKWDVSKTLMIQGSLTLSATSNTYFGIAVPPGFTPRVGAGTNLRAVGSWNCLKVGVARYIGVVLLDTNAGVLNFGCDAAPWLVNQTTPTTWNVGDNFNFYAEFECL